VRDAAIPALAHRVLLGFEGEAEGVRPEELVRRLLELVPEDAAT
jgi:MoxR-like ATPase